MSKKTSSHFHVIKGREKVDALDEVISLLRRQAANIDDTASRCTDPKIVSELKYISVQLQEEARRLEGR